MASPGSGRPVIRGIVFDMDGTLTVPCLDFAEMKRRAGVPPGEDILDCINSWTDAAAKEKAYLAIEQVEEEALANMKVMPGASQLCSFLDQRSVPRGLITRNVRSGVDHFHTHHVKPAGLNVFQPAITRQCDFAYKPSPAAFLHICETWGVAPDQAIMVGDSVKDDVVSGNRAGAVTVLLDYEGRSGYAAEQFEGEMKPSHVVTSLVDVVQLLQEEYDLQPAPNAHGVVVPMDT